MSQKILERGSRRVFQLPMNDQILFERICEYILNSDLEELELLVSNHGPIILNVADEISGVNPLEQAVFWNRTGVFDFLARYLPLTASHKDGTPLLVLACQKAGESLVAKLLEKGLDPNVCGPDKIYPLTMCDILRRYDIARILIRHGAYLK